MSNRHFTLVMPVSGGAFVNQLGIFLHLKELLYKPDAILGSSGGSLAMALIIASGLQNDFATFKSNLLAKTATLEYRDFVNKNGNGLLTFVRSLSTPCLFNHGKGVPDDLLSFPLSEEVELWVSTTCNEDGREKFWTNKETPRLYPGGHGLLKDCRCSVGNFKTTEEFANVVRASTSMQIYLPPFYIHGVPYSDPGILSVSPLQGLAASFTDALFLGGNSGKKVPYNVIYVAPRNIFSPTSE